MTKILWNLFHPTFSESVGNRALLESVQDLPQVTVNRLYEAYPDWKIDVEREQELLRQNTLIVFQHPFYWYSCPALFKEWQDRVLEYGFAYPPKEGTALHGKHWFSVITTGGPDWSYRSGGYNNYTMSELLRPLEQTAHLCGMRWVSPFIVHSVLATDYEGIKASDEQSLRQAGKTLRDFIEKFNPSERHSLEPLISTHYLAKSSGA